MSSLVEKIEKMADQAVATKTTPEVAETQASNDKSVSTKNRKSQGRGRPKKSAEGW